MRGSRLALTMLTQRGGFKNQGKLADVILEHSLIGLLNHNYTRELVEYVHGR